MTPDAWLEAVPERDRPTVEAVDRAVRAAAPELARSVSGETLIYGPFRYRYPSGREGSSALVTIAVRKGGVSVHVNSVRADGAYVAEARADTLGKVKVGRSCITVKRLADLRLDALSAVVAEAARLGGAGEVRT